MLVEELPNLLDGFQGSLTRVRCFAHVLNLVVKVQKSSYWQWWMLTTLKAILSQFNKKKQSLTNDDDDADDADDADLAAVGDEDVDDAEPGAEDGADDDNDELDPSVAQSDEAVIQEVIDGMTGDIEDDSSPTHELRHLTCEEIDLGCYALSKVRCFARS